MADRTTPTGEVGRVALTGLPRKAPVDVSLALEAAAQDAIVRRLDLIALRKPSLTGRLTPSGRQDWDFDGQLGATVVQPCVRTLEPVTTRIDEPVQRRFRAELPVVAEDEDAEIPEDVTVEPLPTSVDLAEIFEEALSLALPAYPLAEGSAPGDMRAAPPGVAPLSDDDVKPLAGLSALRDRLPSDGGGGET